MADFEIHINDNIKNVEEEIKRRCLVGLEASGLAAERIAKMDCHVDTGRLRNSITHQTAGSPAKTHSYAPQHVSKLDGGVDKNGRRKSLSKKQREAQTVKETIPAIPKEEMMMVVGTNVSYGANIEYGFNIGGKHVPARPYIGSALYDNIYRYKAVLKKYLSGK